MEFSSLSKPIVESNISTEALQKYKEEISTLPKEDGWSPLIHLCLYKGFWFYPYFLEGAMYAQDHFQPQPSDIFLCSAMKTGCTWLKSLSFAIATRGQYDDSTSPLRTTVPHDCIPFLEYGEYSTAEGPRIPLVASHLPYTFLPKSIIDSGCKIVYLCRDPKDTFVSMWHFFRKLENNRPGEGDLVSIEEAFELFCKGLSSHGPYWEHVLGYWKASLERPDKILFLKYEDMTKDTEACVKKLAEFFDCPFSLEEERKGIVQAIIKFCSFENLSNLDVNKTGKQVKKDAFVENSAYFRKGKIGDWRNHLTAEMGARLDNIMKEKLSGSGLTF
ncbi:PREDICTED: flavonol sulfotransferase-like [Theobroma cacao]|uniref:Sulfotransferase n=1 Tax=Theobroma cacao TaxID=3641 RepID=A0AB32W722_THECC|nr:PREDICTED: flavonol sulfotransferase-like [Theobroma cacao]